MKEPRYLRNIILTLVVGILLLAVFYIPFTSFTSPYRAKEEKVDTFLYKGHTMVKFTMGHETNVCHSPECSKCRLFYD